MKVQWTILLLIGLLLLAANLALSSGAARVVVAAPITAPVTPVVTLRLPTLPVNNNSGNPSRTPTPTRERYALTQPPTEADVAPVLLTLTALSDVALNQPTPTDGPSEILLDSKPHFVDFNAWWCSPCNQMRPSVVNMREKYGDQVTFDDINVDNRASAKLLRKYKVEFIPLVVLLDKDGNTFQRLEGYQSEQDLDDALDALVAAQ
jgi:thioredoxin 1